MVGAAASDDAGRKAAAAPEPELDDDEIDRIVQQGIDDLDANEPVGSLPVLECPTCGKSDLSYVAGMETGHKYHCPHCDYEGAFAIERDRTPADLRREAGLPP